MSAAVIDIAPSDIVLARNTTGGRFVIFLSTDVEPGWLLPWWGVVLDTGGDGLGILARLDAGAAHCGWTAQQLLAVVRRRTADDAARQESPYAQAAVAFLDRAAEALARVLDDSGTAETVAFLPGGEASPYPWTVAQRGGFCLPLCPDPAGREEGVTPEQLLIVLDQLLRDATDARPHERALWIARRHIAAALAAEVERVAIARREPSPTPPG